MTAGWGGDKKRTAAKSSSPLNPSTTSMTFCSTGHSPVRRSKTARSRRAALPASLPALTSMRQGHASRSRWAGSKGLRPLMARSSASCARASASPEVVETIWANLKTRLALVRQSVSAVRAPASTQAARGLPIAACFIRPLRMPCRKPNASRSKLHARRGLGLSSGRGRKLVASTWLQPHVQANGRPLQARLNLDKVDEVIGEPQASTSARGWRRLLTVHQWHVELAVVGHLADERSINYPDAHICDAPAMTNAISHDLVRGDDDVSNPRVRQPCITCPLGDQRSQPVQLLRTDDQRLMVSRRIGEWCVEGRAAA